MKTFKYKKSLSERFEILMGWGWMIKFALNFAVYIINIIFIISAFLTFYTSTSLVYVWKYKLELWAGYCVAFWC